MLNHCELMGRITAPLELKSTPSGRSVLSFSIAVERNIKDQNGVRQTDFIQIAAWQQTAEHIARYFDKGSPIIVEGSIQTRSWTDGDGSARRTTEVVAERVHFAGGSKSGDSGQDTPVVTGAVNKAIQSKDEQLDALENLGDEEELPF